MGPDDTVTQWILRLKGVDREEAARRLWERYGDRLVSLARDRLRDARRGAADEEDVALDAFDSFHRGVRAGRFPRLDDRDDLWRVLFTIAVRKAIDLRDAEARASRGGGRRNFSELAPGDLDAARDVEPGPEVAAQFADEVRRRMGELDDPGLHALAAWKLEGYHNAEIADRMGCSLPTVERKLRRIRLIWEEDERPRGGEAGGGAMGTGRFEGGSRDRRERMARVDRACDRFEAAWRSGDRPRIEDYLGDVAGLDRDGLLADLLAVEAAYCDQPGASTTAADGRAEGQAAQCPPPYPDIPGFEVQGVLGRGGAGIVYLARGRRLNRPCALKMIDPGGRPGAGSVTILDASAPRRLFTIPAEGDSVRRLAFDPAGTALAVAGQGQDVALWDLDRIGSALVGLGLGGGADAAGVGASRWPEGPVDVRVVEAPPVPRVERWSEVLRRARLGAMQGRPAEAEAGIAHVAALAEATRSASSRPAGGSSSRA